MIDFDALTPGQYISPEQLEQQFRTHVSPDVTVAAGRHAPGYRPFLLRLRDEVMSRRPDLVARTDHDGIRILTPAECVGEQRDVRRRALRGLLRATLVSARTAADQLTPEEKRAFEHETRLTTAALAGARKGVRKTLGELARAPRLNPPPAPDDPAGG